MIGKKGFTLINFSNYKPQYRITGTLIVVIKILIMTAMMKKVKIRRRNIMHIM